MGKTLPQALWTAGPLKTYHVRWACPHVVIEGTMAARSEWEVQAWWDKRFAGVGRPTITEVAA